MVFLINSNALKGLVISHKVNCYHINTALTYYVEIIIITNLADVVRAWPLFLIEISLVLFTQVVLLIFNVISCIRYVASFVFYFVFFLAFAVVSFIASLIFMQMI